MKQLAILVLSAFCLSSFNGLAKDSTAEFRQALLKVPAAEMPAKAASLVKKAKARDWGSTTVNVVKAAVAVNPAAAPAIVGAISRSVPEMASIAASTAAAEQPKQASLIAKAAAAAAPAKAGRIVTSVCREVPAAYREVALAVVEAAPASGKEVLNGVATAIPTYKTSLEPSLSQPVVGAPMVAMALDNVPVTAAGPLPQGPTVGAPYLPLSTTPQRIIIPDNTVVVPPGGRDYVSPF